MGRWAVVMPREDCQDRVSLLSPDKTPPSVRRGWHRRQGKTYISVLGAAAVAQQLGVLGHDDGAGIVRGGSGVERAGELGDRSSDAGHDGCSRLGLCRGRGLRLEGLLSPDRSGRPVCLIYWPKKCGKRMRLLCYYIGGLFERVSRQRCDGQGERDDGREGITRCKTRTTGGSTEGEGY